MLIRARQNQVVVTNAVPNFLEFLREGATVGALGTIAYVALAASTTGWMVVGVLAAFMAISTFINMMISFF